MFVGLRGANFYVPSNILAKRFIRVFLHLFGQVLKKTCKMASRNAHVLSGLVPPNQRSYNIFSPPQLWLVASHCPAYTELHDIHPYSPIQWHVPPFCPLLHDQHTMLSPSMFYSHPRMLAQLAQTSRDIVALPGNQGRQLVLLGSFGTLSSTTTIGHQVHFGHFPCYTFGPLRYNSWNSQCCRPTTCRLSAGNLPLTFCGTTPLNTSYCSMANQTPIKSEDAISDKHKTKTLRKVWIEPRPIDVNLT